MSRDAENAAWATSIPTAPKMVLISLGDQCNDAGWAFARIEYIAKRCSMSDRNVFRMIDLLHEEGFITIKPRKGRSSIYIVHVSGDGEPLITAERTTPDNLSGVKRIEFAERLAAQTIADLMEKRFAVKEERSRSRASSAKGSSADQGKESTVTPDNLSGVGENNPQASGPPDNLAGGDDIRSGGGDNLSGAPDVLSPIILSSPVSKSSLNHSGADQLKKLGGTKNRAEPAKADPHEFERQRTAQLSRIREKLQQAGQA